MADDVLEIYIRQLLAAQPDSEVNVAWQGGEPTLMGLAFFRRSSDLVAKYKKPGQKIMHTIQTNGILLNDEWARFFKAHGFLVGLSIDGPCLVSNEVDVNILCTVHAANGDHGLEVYRFFRLNYLCAGYRKFFNHIDRPMRTMASLLKNGRFADEIMTIEAGAPA
jgi:uncharacterized protein